MRFFQSVVACALAAVAVAQQAAPVAFTTVPTNIQAGQPVKLEYSSANPGAPVTIILRKGDSNDLQTISTITSSATGGSYSWTPDTTLAPGSDYAFQIVQNGATNYSGKISITGGNGTPMSASGSMTTAAASMSSASVSDSASSMMMMSSMASNMTMTSSNMTMTMTTSATATSSGASSSGASSTSRGSSTSGSSTSAPTGNAAAVAHAQSPVALLIGALLALAYVN